MAQPSPLHHAPHLGHSTCFENFDKWPSTQCLSLHIEEFRVLLNKSRESSFHTAASQFSGLPYTLSRSRWLPLEPGALCLGHLSSGGRVTLSQLLSRGGCTVGTLSSSMHLCPQAVHLPHPSPTPPLVGKIPQTFPSGLMNSYTSFKAQTPPAPRCLLFFLNIHSLCPLYSGIICFSLSTQHKYRWSQSHTNKTHFHYTFFPPINWVTYTVYQITTVPLSCVRT